MSRQVRVVFHGGRLISALLLTVRVKLVEPLVGVRELTDSGMVRGDLLVALAEKVPPLRVESSRMVGNEVVLGARDGLDPKCESISRKVEISVEKP